MKKYTVCFSALLLLGISQVSLAECIYNGYTVPTGSKAGGLVCQANGEWK